MPKNTPPCKHTTPQPDNCRWCNMALHKDRRYARLWWDNFDDTSEVKLQAQCAHLGGATGETLPCGTCKNTVISLYACAVYGECTLERQTQSAACCNNCNQRKLS